MGNRCAIAHHLQYKIEIAHRRLQRVEKLVCEFRSLTDTCQKLLAGSGVDIKA